MDKYIFRHVLRAFCRLLLFVVVIISVFNPSTIPVYAHTGWQGSMSVKQVSISDPFGSMISSSTHLKSEPILLHYLIRLIGNDWLGADWLYVGLTAYRYPALDSSGQQILATDPRMDKPVPQWNIVRFWTDPGPALLKIGDILWVWGFEAGSHTVYADSILVNPPARAAPPDDISAFGKVLTISAQTITIQDPEGINSTVTADSYTMYSFPDGVSLPRPKQGLWLDISWLTGTDGLLGRYNGFHGSYRGILRLDFSQP